MRKFKIIHHYESKTTHWTTLKDKEILLAHDNFSFKTQHILLLLWSLHPAPIIYEKRNKKINFQQGVKIHLWFKFQNFFLQFDLVLCTFTREARKSSSSSSSSLDLQKRYYRKHILLIFKASQIHYISGRLIQNLKEF